MSLVRLSLTLVLLRNDSLPADIFALQKNKQIRTVVNKLDSIHSQFRFFEMELLAGEPDYVVEHVSMLATPLHRTETNTSASARVRLQVHV